MMLKKLSVLLVAAGVFCTPVYADKISDSLWETVRTGQIRGLPAGLSGAWQEDITVKDNQQVIFTDLSPFSALQIMMRLDAINANTPLHGYAQVKENFKSFVNYYLNHHLQGEPVGSIGFWPVWTLEDGTIARLPSADPAMLELMGGSLPADSDDSSQMAIWLYKTDPDHPYLKAYLRMLEGVMDANRNKQSEREGKWKAVNSGAFMTWVSGVSSEENSVDCVVNINVLTSLAILKNKYQLTPVLQQAEKDTTALVYDALTEKKFPACSYYYSRWSHFYLALGKLYEAGGGEFTQEQWQVIRKTFKSALRQRWTGEKHQTSIDWAELLLTAKMLKLTDDAELTSTLSGIRQYLQQKARRDDYYTLIEGNDVFRGQVRPGMFLLWYVKAQTAATIMEALAD